MQNQTIHKTTVRDSGTFKNLLVLQSGQKLCLEETNLLFHVAATTSFRHFADQLAVSRMKPELHLSPAKLLVSKI